MIFLNIDFFYFDWVEFWISKRWFYTYLLGVNNLNH